MKIAIITSPFIKVFPGIEHTPFSISSIAYNLSEELVKRGHKISLFATADSITSACVPKGLIKSTDPLIKNIACNSAIYEKLCAEHFKKVIAIADQFDIINSHDNDFIPYSRLTNTQTVSTMHGPAVSKKENLRFNNEKMIALSNNQKEKNSCLHFVGVAYNGIKINDYPLNPKNSNYLAWLGRITPLKGTIEAVKAAKRAGMKIVLAGNLDPSAKEYAKTVLEEIKKSKGNAEFIGEAGKEKKINLLSNAAAVLMPIKWEEPFGLVALEAMACGTPVIAFNKGALPEIVKNKKTGFLVKNIAEMAEAIKAVEKISRHACRKSVEVKFTVEKMAERYEKIFTKVVKNS